MNDAPRVRMLTTFEDPRRLDTFKGGYRRTTEMARLLRGRVDLRLCNVSRQPVGDLSDIGVPWESLVAPSLPARLARTAAWLLRRTRRGDLVLAYNPSLVTAPSVLAGLGGRRLVIDYVDHQGAVTAQGLRHRATSGLRTAVGTAMVRATRHFVTSSAPLEDEIRETRRDARVHRYYGTLYRPRPAPGEGPPPRRSGPLRVLYMGSMMAISGADDLVHAVAALPPGTATLELAGGGPHRPIVERAVAAAGGCARLITLDDDALYPALAGADVLALPLHQSMRNAYNFPSRVVEFLWAGRPIVATDIPPLRGFLRHGDNAWLVPEHGPGPLRDALATLAGDPALCARLARGAARFFEETLSPPRVASALSAFLEEAAAG